PSFPTRRTSDLSFRKFQRSPGRRRLLSDGAELLLLQFHQECVLFETVPFSLPGYRYDLPDPFPRGQVSHPGDRSLFVFFFPIPGTTGALQSVRARWEPCRNRCIFQMTGLPDRKFPALIPGRYPHHGIESSDSEIRVLHSLDIWHQYPSPCPHLLVTHISGNGSFRYRFSEKR